MKVYKWKPSKSVTILGLPAEYIKVPDLVDGKMTREYRLKNNNADIFEYKPGIYRAIVNHKPLARTLLDKGIHLVSGWSDERNVGPEEFLFQFDTGRRLAVLSVLGFSVEKVVSDQK